MLKLQFNCIDPQAYLCHIWGTLRHKKLDIKFTLPFSLNDRMDNSFKDTKKVQYIHIQKDFKKQQPIIGQR